MSRLGEAKKARKTINQPLPNQASKCSWCGTDASKTEFNFFTRDVQNVICKACVDKFHVMGKIEGIRLMSWTKAEFARLKFKMKKAVAGERAPDWMKEAAVDLAVVLAKNSHDIFKAAARGDKIRPDRFRIKDDIDIGHFRALLERAAAEIGIVVLEVGVEELENGEAEKKALDAYGGDYLLMAHAVLLARGVSQKDTARCTTICVDNDHELAVSMRDQYCG